MKRKLTSEYIHKQLEFGISVAYALDVLNKYENDTKTVTAVVAQLLVQLGYSEEDSYGAATMMNITDMTDLINEGEIIATLPSLVCAASTVIEKKLIPDFIRNQVKETLASQ